MKPKIDYSSLTEDQRRALELDSHNKKQIEVLTDVADITQELLGVTEDGTKKQGEQLEHLGVLMVAVKEELEKLSQHEDPELPDFSKPLIPVFEKMQKSIDKLETQVNVEAPNVTLEAPDFSELTDIIKKDLPKAFKAAVGEITIPEHTPTDLDPLLEKLGEVTEWLESIDHASRMKPTFPNTMTVTGALTDTQLRATPVPVSFSTTVYKKIIDDTTTANVTYIGEAATGTGLGTAAWRIKKIDETSGVVITWAGTSFNATWNNRTSETYA